MKTILGITSGPRTDCAHWQLLDRYGSDKNEPRPPITDSTLIAAFPAHFTLSKLVEVFNTCLIAGKIEDESVLRWSMPPQRKLADVRPKRIILFDMEFQEWRVKSANSTLQKPH